MTDIDVGIASLGSADVAALLSVHQQRMLGASPPGTSYALDLSGLQIPEVTVFEARRGGCLLGVGALKQLPGRDGEIKSMRTVDTALRQGVGQALLKFIETAARQRGYDRLLLETGTGVAFDPANRLYTRNGFVRREPFGDYTETQFNIFYEKLI